MKIAPIHPGVTLLEDFMKPLGLNANRMALALRVPAQQVSEIINGQRGINASDRDQAWEAVRYDAGVLDEPADELCVQKTLEGEDAKIA